VTTTGGTPRQEDFYQRLRQRIRKWVEREGRNHEHAEVLLYAPDLFHVLVRLTLDDRVPSKEKTKLGIAVAYFITPLDLMPEALLGPVGYLDDIALAAYALNSVLNAGYGEIAQEHWAGDEDLLHVTQRLVAIADDMLPKSMIRKLVRKVGGGG
jgi:uncharacterized membrane protein YkvA (DUF1232 family)